MTIESIVALVVFAFVMSVTPGPNNVMLLASGANYGFLRTMPQMVGVTLGFSSVILAVGLGLGGLLSAVPLLHTTLKYAGAAFLAYLAWRIITSPVASSSGQAQRPISFVEAVTFQWINPKAWIVAAAAVSSYGGGTPGIASIGTIAAVIALVNFPTIGLWAGVGALLKRPLARPKRLRVFNVAMGILMAASLVPIILTE